MVSWVVFSDFYSAKTQVVEVKKSLQMEFDEIQEEILENPPKSACIIQEPVYSEEEVKKVYRFKTFSNCKTPTNDFIEIRETEIFAKCENAEARFIIDNGKQQVFGGEFKNKDIRWSKRNELRPGSEYAFVKCGVKSVYAFAFIRFNSTVARRAKEIKDLLGKDSKPMNVLLLVFDSLSRFTVGRYLPLLRQFMNQGISGEGFHPKYSAYEFKRVGTPETFTIPNMIQILYGDHWDKVKTKLEVKKPPFEGISEPHLKFQREKAIWSYYSKLGFTTLYLMDTVWDFTVRFIGRKVLADHVLANYWRDAWAVFGYEDFSNKQRCVGNQDSHNLTFSYVFDYFQKYRSFNKFAYVHLDAAHERSGNIQTVDKDIVPFINGLFQLFQQNSENFAMFLLSDHGIRFPYLQFDIRNQFELTSPMSFFIIDKEIENKLEARSNLHHNSHQLVGRMDMNYALKYLAHMPYGHENSSYFDSLKKDLPVSSIYNLFTEKIDPSRHCKDLDLMDYKCVCSNFIELNSPKILTQLIAMVEQYTKLKAYQSENCSKLEEIQVISSKKFVTGPANRGLVTLYKIELLVNKKAVVEADFVFCYPGKMKDGYKKIEDELFPFREYNLKNGQAIIQLRKIKISGCGLENCAC
jgi:hypothetical protein